VPSLSSSQLVQFLRSAVGFLFAESEAKCQHFEQRFEDANGKAVDEANLVQDALPPAMVRGRERSAQRLCARMEHADSSSPHIVPLDVYVGYAHPHAV